MMTLQQSTLRQLTGKLENPSVEYLDSLPFSYGKGDPNSPDAVVQHVTTQGTYKKRNAGNGENHRFIGNLCLISIFQFWEDYYRARIAKSLGPRKR
jgi:hypothetical protein